jgi:hypothetical protein
MTIQADTSSQFSSNDFDIRRDLPALVEYVIKRGIKRSHRENAIPRADCKRLSKILGVPGILVDVEEEQGTWAEWICELARKMGFVSYDIKGVYAGYSSREPSFPDNHIEVNQVCWDSYLALPSSAKERKILSALAEHNGNEFYTPSMLGTQERFDSFGSGVGAASRMKLPRIRRRLLEMLATYTPGQPVLIEDFVKRIQMEAPNLIIDHLRVPKEQPVPPSQTRYGYTRTPYAGSSGSVYENLVEIQLKEENGVWKVEHGGNKEISEQAPNAFMLAEGRYLSYFLEEIPVLMNFVRLEYSQDDVPSQVRPQFPNFIKCFTVNEKLAFLIDPHGDQLDRVNVTINPDFNVIVEAPLYPDRELALLAPYTEIKSVDQHTVILTLSRDKTVETLTANPKAKPISEALGELVADIPQNVAADIVEWSGHAEKLVVYENVGLLEIRDVRPETFSRTLAALGAAISQALSSHFFLLDDPEMTYRQLEQLEQVPGKIRHGNKSLHESLLNKAGSGKAKAQAKPAPLEKRQKISIVESSLLGFKSSNADFLSALVKHLTEAGVVPLFFDKPGGMIAVPDTARPHINAFIKRKRADCIVEMKELVSSDSD